MPNILLPRSHCGDRSKRASLERNVLVCAAGTLCQFFLESDGKPASAIPSK